MQEGCRRVQGCRRGAGGFKIMMTTTMTMTGMLILDAIMTHCISSMTTIRASSTIHQAAHHHRQPAMVRRDGIYIWGT